uniref:Uncharacterized protein n=1 Tax=Arundo donax TaxID=35708 RepID=A0A0A9BM10_ARUDO
MLGGCTNSYVSTLLELLVLIVDIQGSMFFYYTIASKTIRIFVLSQFFSLTRRRATHHCIKKE